MVYRLRRTSKQERGRPLRRAFAAGTAGRGTTRGRPLRQYDAAGTAEGRTTRGQIIIPALFVLPSLFLFVFLIFETAKLSREKIRHQFALDAAVFVEMTNYADFVNRSAYVNGAFPQRIFQEGFEKTTFDDKATNGSNPRSLYEMMFANGAFPRTAQGQPLDPHPVWNIRYCEEGQCSSGRDYKEHNQNPPDFNASYCENHSLTDPSPSRWYHCLEIISHKDANDYWISWDDANDIYKLYAQIYTLLGSVEDAQYSVFCRLTGASGCTAGGLGHNFFRKSYWLNTGDPDAIERAKRGAGGFDAFSFKPKFYCIPKLMITGNKPTSNRFKPYELVSNIPPIDMPATIQNCDVPGLFQVAAVAPGDLEEMRAPHLDSPYPGYPVSQDWRAPSNYFRVDFNKLMQDDDGEPLVHATISLGVSGGKVWPDPTPKFQTRLYP